MSKRAIFAASTAVILGFGGVIHAQTAPAAVGEVTAQTVLAVVDGTEITLGHVMLARQALPPEYQQLPDDILFQGLIEQLIQQTALSNAAGDLSGAAQMMVDNEVRSIRAGDAIEDLLAGVVTEDSVRAAYEAEILGLEPETEFHAAHILVETLEEAEALLVQLGEGAVFGDLAREFSTGPSGPNGGDLGWFGMGMMVPEFENAVVSMEVGAYSDPVETQFGWHVIHLMETRMTEAPAYEVVADQIRNTMEMDAVDALVNDLVEAADVDRSGSVGIDPSALSNTDLLLVEVQ